MSPTVANDATEREKAPDWRPGPDGRRVAAVLSGVALRASQRHDRLDRALAPGPDRASRDDDTHVRDSAESASLGSADVRGPAPARLVASAPQS